MSYPELISEIGIDAERLETSYRAVVAEGDEHAFAAAIDGAYTDDPENLLYAAWHYRLAYALADRLDEWRIAWAWAIPLAIVNGLLLWWLSDDARFSVQIMGDRRRVGATIRFPMCCCSGRRSARLPS